jgi:CPA2 family monovalent cation:H+ antiporter-2
MHSGEIIADLGILAVLGVLSASVCRVLGISGIIGYLIAGVLAGPHALAWVQANEVMALGELGVVFLMFHLGMEFDLTRLRKLLIPSVIAVMLQTAGMLFLGFQVAPMLGLDGLHGFFLGSLLAISSSMVTVRVLEETGEAKLAEGQLVVGVLILEDILAVLLLVVLSGVGLKGVLSWGGLFQAVFLVSVFVAVFYTVGRFMMPRLAGWFARLGKAEFLTLFSAALALGMGLLAARFELSLALGAFVAGATLSQTSFVDEIERRMVPVRELSGAIFFISIGMWIDPSALISEWRPILGLAVGVVAVKVFTVWLGLFLSGEKAQTSFRAASAKPQIGEFSFVIAGLGISLGVTEERLMTLAVGIAVMTILATPLLHHNAGKTCSWLGRCLPQGVRGFGRVYHDFVDAMRGRFRRASLLETARPLFLRSVFYFFLLNGIYVIGYILAGMILSGERAVEKGSWQALLIWSIAGGVSLPILIAVIFNVNQLMRLIAERVLGSKARKSFGRGRLAMHFEALSTCLLVALAGGIFFSFASPYLPEGMALIGYCTVLVLAAVLLWNRLLKVNLQLENLFLKELDEQLTQEDRVQRQEAFQQIESRYPWPVQVQVVDITKDANVVGRRICDLNLRRLTGVSILGLGRGGVVSYELSPEITIFPGDRLYLFGTTSQTSRASSILEISNHPAINRNPGQADYHMETIFLSHDSPLVDTTLAGSNLRQKHGINVLALQRGETRIAPPDGEELLREGDVLYVFGRKDAIAVLSNVNVGSLED